MAHDTEISRPLFRKEHLSGPTRAQTISRLGWSAVFPEPSTGPVYVNPDWPKGHTPKTDRRRSAAQ